MFTAHHSRTFTSITCIAFACLLVCFLHSDGRAQGQQNSSRAADLTKRSNLTVDPSTLALNLEFQLADYPGRGGSFPVALRYSSKVWRMNFIQPGGQFDTYRAWIEPWWNYDRTAAGWTSSLGVPLLVDSSQELYSSNGGPTSLCNPSCYLVRRVEIRMPDGSSHELRHGTAVAVWITGQQPPSMAGMYFASDGSQLKYDYNSRTLYLPEGSRYILGDTVTNTTFFDRNGNKLLYNPSTKKWTDTLGREINAPPVPQPFPPSLPAWINAGDYNYTVPGVGGTTLTYIFRWRSLTDARTNPSEPMRYAADCSDPNFPGSQFPNLYQSPWPDSVCTPGIFDPVLLYEIVLPNNAVYRFTYNMYGELDKVVYPTGGYERFRYEQIAAADWLRDAYAQGNRGVVERWVSANGTGSDEIHTTYSAGYADLNYTLPYKVTTTEHDGTRTERLLHTATTQYPFGFSDVRIGRPYEERIYSPANQMLRRTLTEWTGSVQSTSNGNFSNARDPRETKRVEIQLDTGGNALVKTATFGYDADLNLTSTNHYEFVSVPQSTGQTAAIGSLSSGTLLRTEETTYLVNDPAIAAATRQAYRDRNLVALPSSNRVRNSVGTIVAQGEMRYDEAAYPLLTYGAVTSWTDPLTSIRGNATTARRWLNTTGSWIEAHSQYDQCGNVRKVWDANGNVSEVEYSSTYHRAYPTLTRTPPPDPSSSPMTTTAVFDFGTGLMTSSTDANSQTTTFDYTDPLNRLKVETRPTGGGSTIYSYDDTPGSVSVRTQTALDATRFADSYQYFDGIGRLIETRNFEDNGQYISVKQVPFVMLADPDTGAMVRATQTSNAFRPPGEQPNWTTNFFDSLGRLTKTRTPDNAIFRTSYSGNVTIVTDQAGRKRKRVYDALGRLTNVFEDPDGSNFLTTYTYNALDSVTTITMGSQTRTFAYNSLKQMISASNPENGTISYQYDADDNLLVKTDARGVSIHYSYDALSRITRRWYNGSSAIGSTTHNSPALPANVGATNEVRFYYDSQSLPGGAPPFSRGASLGHLVAQVYGTGSNGDYYGYDTLGRQNVKIQQTGSSNYQMLASYNFAGAITTLTYPSGHTVNHSHDQAGRLSSLTGNLGDGTTRTYSTGITYSPFGSLSREQFGTSTPLYHKLFYNIRGQIFDTRVSSVNDLWDWNRGRLILYYSSNHFWGQSGTDNNGNVLFAETWIPPANATLDQTDTLIEDSYNFDALNRLTSVTEHKMSVAGGWGNWTQQFKQTYTYDRYGNRTINTDPAQTWGTGINNKSFTVDTGTNRLGVPGGQPGVMTYDAAGNLTNDTYTGAGGRTYDAENKIVSAFGGNQTQLYSYDGSGQRIKRVVNGVETWQVYGFGGELLAEYPANAASGNPRNEYSYRNGQLLITADARTNVALAANGGVASASSSHTCCGFSLGGAINGNTSGPWGNGEGWNDATENVLPDWYQVDFAGSRTIDEIDVYSLHDNYTQANTPSESQTFSLYGLVNFQVQYWNNSAWTTIPGGNVTGNNKVWRKFTFAPITTSKIRLWITGVPDPWSRLVELQAWGAGGSATNLALNKPVTQSSTDWGGVPQRGVDGNTDGNYWSGSVTHTAVQTQPWWQVDLQSVTNINSVNVWNRTDCCGEALTNFYVFVSDNPFTANDVASTQAQAGVSTYFVAGQGSTPSMIGVNRTGRYVRVQLGNVERLSVAEVQVIGGGGTAQVNWIVPDHLGTPRMVLDQTGSLANLKRHDYLPFGEELFAPTGGRSTALGYASGDGIRQQFTGKERDFETGLDYFGARYYSAIQGRFTGVDPENASGDLKDPQSWNGYAYARNNPLHFVDPDGRDYQVHWGNEPRPVNLRDSEFFKLKKDLEAQGFIVKNGNIYAKVFDDDGNVIGLRVIGTYISDMNSLGEGFIREMANRRAEPLARSMEYMWIYMSFFTLPASQAIPAAGWLSKGLTTTLCFVAGTPVMTNEGLKVIEEIQPGDQIASYNEQTKRIEYKPVVQTFERYAEQVLLVSVQGEEDPLGVTPTHPFCVPRENTSSGEDECDWREAGQLRVGDRIKVASGGWSEVAAVASSKGSQVYNFEVADNHNYYVGRQGLLVHNQCATITLRQLAQQIVKHAFKKHVLHQGEYPGWIRTTKQLEQLVEKILMNPTAMKNLSHGRVAFWDEASGTVIILNSKNVGQSTVFQPTNGLAYFNNLR